MNKNILLIALMAVLMVGLAGIASATLTLNISTGTQTNAFNIGADSTTMDTMVNCTWYAYVVNSYNILENTSSTNTFKFTINSSSTDRANHTRITFSNPASDLQDSNYYVYTTCSNHSGASSETSSTTGVIITVNRGSPICATNLPFASRTTQLPDATWTATSGNATGATLYFGAGIPKSMSLSSVSARQQSWSYKGDIPETTYDHIYVAFSDGNDLTTCSTSDYVTIKDSKDTRANAVVISEEAKAQKKGGSSFLLLIAAGVVIYYVTKGQGKKKK